jgi:serine/threonine-protein kinase HipA
VYGRQYLRNESAIALDPFNLPLEEKEFVCAINGGIFGPIRDASPDSWGRRVIEKNTPASEWDEVGYLLNSAGDRVGSLSFGVGKTPPAPVRDFNQTIQLETLIRAAHKIEQDQPVSNSERTVLNVGSSMGGARPKAVVEHENCLWLAKFPSHHDRRNYPKIEFATMRMAEECGIRVPKIKLIKIGERDVFLIERFDRTWVGESDAYIRHHFVSGLTLLGVDEKDRDRWSYLDLAAQMRRWISKPQGDLKELFKRIVFNCLISNTDDHPRNHGFLYHPKSYHLSPAYDLVPQPSASYTRDLAMPFGSQGRVIRLENILSHCSDYGLEKSEAKAIYDEMKTRLLQWRSFYETVGVTSDDLKYLESAFSWEGIE